MKKNNDSFFKCVITLFTRLFSGRVHFIKVFAGKTITMEDSKRFHVIRDLKIDPRMKLAKSASVFKVRFKFSGLPLKINKRLSMFPTPFLIAKPGFLEKIWTFSEDETFQGIYQFISKEEAEAYPDSFIFKLMTKRAAEGTLSFEIVPDTTLEEYIGKLI